MTDPVLSTPDLPLGHQCQVEVADGSGTRLITVIAATGGGGSVTNVTASAPLTSSGGATPNIGGIPSAVGVGVRVLETDAGGTLSWGPGTPGPTTAWPGAAVAIAAGAAPTLAQHAAQSRYLDATGAAINVTMPAAPVDGDTVTLTMRANVPPTPATVTPSAGQTIDDPADPGFSAPGAVQLTFAGQAVTWQWVAALADWVIIINS